MRGGDVRRDPDGDRCAGVHGSPAPGGERGCSCAESLASAGPGWLAAS